MGNKNITMCQRMIVFRRAIVFYHSIQKPISTKAALMHVYDLSRSESTAWERSNIMWVDVCVCGCVLCAHNSIRIEKYPTKPNKKTKTEEEKKTLERWEFVLKSRQMLKRNLCFGEMNLMKTINVCQHTILMRCGANDAYSRNNWHTHTSTFAPHLNYAYLQKKN